MARAAEKNERASRLQQFIHAGHAKVDYRLTTAIVIVGDDIIEEAMERFPSTKLLARVALAVEFGQTCRDTMKEYQAHATDAFAYAVNTAFRQDYVWFDEAAVLTADLKTLTATVKKPRALKKGLRP